MDWSQISWSLLENYYYDIFGTYPPEHLTREEVIELIKSRW